MLFSFDEYRAKIAKKRDILLHFQKMSLSLRPLNSNKGLIQ